MTAPGWRGFLLEALPGDEQNLLSAALATLAEAFTVIAEPAAPGAGPRRRSWLDTFDWRLYRAGLILVFEQARRGGRLLLSQADGTPQAEQAVTSWPRRPPLDLPEGPVRDRIIVLTRPRALLPVVRAVSTASVTRLLNADGKTVARLVADRITVTAPSQPAASHAATSQIATTAELAPRLAVTEVRGYPGQARKASALLAGVPGVAPASQGTFMAALTALGRHPADYNSGVAAEITAAMPAPVAVARLLLRLLDTVESNVDGVLRDIDTEFLHDLRVAVRRTRSAVKLLGAVLPDELAKHYQAEFKWLGDVTTPVRDLDVHLLGFDAMAAQLAAASPADLEPLRAFLARRAREPGEPDGELLPGLRLAARQLGGDFPHGQQRSRRGGPFGQHRFGQRADLAALDLAVLEVTEAVLQLLEVADDLAVRDRVVQRGEELQQVAQLLGALAQVVQGFGR